ncbi:AbiJ-NTD4 domain-containing protein [Variovorax boronicumulans]|uniref:AbiJ-NTD4 domain-containing protein n=1 Tax=Variovorax boronicumulans TaxID=436515 RepID=UPI0036F2ADA2
MATFSQRTGLVPLEKAIQLQTIDQDLRNGLWNVIQVFVWARYRPNDDRFRIETKQVAVLVHEIFLNLYKEAVDRIPPMGTSRYGEKLHSTCSAASSWSSHGMRSTT